MLNRKITGIFLIIALAAGISITTTRCYDDNDDKEARVTIHLERNDLAALGIKPQPEKHFIDRVLEFFSTPAEAAFWSPDHLNNLTLTVSSDSFENIIFTIPANASTYSTVIPSGNNITLTITHAYFDFDSGKNQINWGGETTTNLGPGDNDISIQMKPTTWLTSISPSTGVLYVNWKQDTNIYPYVSSINVYRSTSIQGPYTFRVNQSISSTYNDTSVTVGMTYYYKIRAISAYGESILSEPLGATAY
jgi:hypothetical protein